MWSLVWESMRDARIRAILLLTMFIAAYWVPLRSMTHTWMNEEDYSYGFYIPAISAYLIWENRAALRNVRIETSWKILPLLCFTVLLSIYGILGSSGNIAMPAVPLLLLLFVTFNFGAEAFRKLLLPLAFLFFMVPVPAFIERSLGIFLKSISTKLGAAVIEFFHIPVHVSGNIIDLGVTRLQVVDACNGMRFLFPLLAIGVLYAKFFQRSWWRRLICIIATLPIAVLINGLRVGITGILCEHFGKTAAEGFFHDFEGWAMFMVAFFILFLLGKFLRLIPSGDLRAKPAETGTTQNNSAIRNGMQMTGAGAFFVSVFLLVLVCVLSFSTSALPAVKIRGGIAAFPLAFGGWEGHSEIVSPEIVAKSGAEESFSGQYVNGANLPVSLYIGYRSTAYLENENFFHSPTVCLPSSGWTPVRTTTRTIGNVPVFGELPVTEMLIENTGSRDIVYFWFQTKSRATHDKSINRFHLTLHAIERENTYDLFIRPITRIAAGETTKSAEARLDNFVRTMMSAMNAFLIERIR